MPRYLKSILTLVVFAMIGSRTIDAQKKGGYSTPEQPTQAIESHAPSPAKDAPPTVFREPITVKLRVDKDHYYQENFGKIPYVNSGEVYLFAGETFGINVAIADNEISHISYQPDVKKADLKFVFTQDKSKGDGVSMMLIIENKLKHKIYINALMTVPGKKGIYKTTILPVEAGLSNYESWPHPIVQLVLQNIRFSEKPIAPSTAEQ